MLWHFSVLSNKKVVLLLWYVLHYCVNGCENTTQYCNFQYSILPPFLIIICDNQRPIESIILLMPLMLHNISSIQQECPIWRQHTLPGNSGSRNHLTSKSIENAPQPLCYTYSSWLCHFYLAGDPTLFKPKFRQLRHWTTKLVGNSRKICCFCM